MNAMFKEIRQSDIEKIRARIEKNHDVVNEIFTGKKPLKDIGQSPLQVAIKCGEFEIIDLLIDNGADVDFMENRETQPPDTEDHYFMPMPIIDDAITGAFESICYGEFERSDKYVQVIRRLLERGANPNKETYPHPKLKTTKMPLDVLLSEAAYLHTYDENKRKKAQECLLSILILFREHGADFESWLNQIFSSKGDLTKRAVFLEGSEIWHDAYVDVVSVFQQFYKG